MRRDATLFTLALTYGVHRIVNHSKRYLKSGKDIHKEPVSNFPLSQERRMLASRDVRRKKRRFLRARDPRKATHLGRAS